MSGLTDRELLEGAARAISLDYHIDKLDGVEKLISNAYGAVWNPLCNDGQALRLAAKLLLNVLSSEACIVAEDENGIECIEYMYGPEDYASGWRRAITRAAYEIGSAKP